MTSPPYAKIFQVLTSAHINWHGLSTHFAVLSNGKCPNCIHDIHPLILQMCFFPICSLFFRVFPHFPSGIGIPLCSITQNEATHFVFLQGSEESVESRRSSSENVKWPHKPSPSHHQKWVVWTSRSHSTQKKNNIFIGGMFTIPSHGHGWF